MTVESPCPFLVPIDRYCGRLEVAETFSADSCKVQFRVFPLDHLF